MARFFKNNILPIATVFTVLGLLLTILSWTVAYSSTSYLDVYRNALKPINDWADGDTNLIIMIGAPILLLSAAWYMGEQIAKRRRFERLFVTDKKSDFARNRRDLEDIARDLPDSYRQRIKDREKELSGQRESERRRTP